METVIEKLSSAQRKKHIVNVKSGDMVRVHQKIREGNKERVQVFHGLVMRTAGMNSLMARITVRRIASGIGVEKSFLLNSPLITRIEVTKRSKVRRNYLSYMRNLTGKSARLSSLDFDRNAVNDIPEDEVKLESKDKQDEQEANDSKETDTSNNETDKSEIKEAEEKTDSKTDKTA